MRGVRERRDPELRGVQGAEISLEDERSLGSGDR